jgi:UDP-glucose 4-epimerase
VNSLITGGAGFIGSHLAEELLRRGEGVWVIDDLSTGRYENVAHLAGNPKFHLQIDTIMDQGVMEGLIDRCDLVYHLAAAVGVRLIVDKPVETMETNILGAEIVLKLANREKKKVIVSSSSEIYGKSDNVPFKEDDDRILGSTTMRRWCYSCSKAIDEFLALAYHQEKKSPVVIARMFNTVGPRQTGQYGMVVPRFVQSALLGHPIQVYGDGEQTRCFTYVDDVVEALIGLAHSPQAEGEIFNVGSEEEISINELAKMVKRLTKSRSPIEHLPYEKAYEKGFEDMRRRVPDLTKIRSLIGFRPKVNLEEMLLKIIDYFKR